FSESLGGPTRLQQTAAGAKTGTKPDNPSDGSFRPIRRQIHCTIIPGRYFAGRTDRGNSRRNPPLNKPVETYFPRKTGAEGDGEDTGREFCVPHHQRRRFYSVSGLQ